MPVYIVGPGLVLAALLLAALLMWLQDRTENHRGRKVTVSLTDGTALTGRTRLAWPGRIRLVEVETEEGEVPGMVIINARHVLAVQVTA